MFKDYTPIRSVDFFKYFESFLVSAIFAIMGIRIFLKFTNYFELGGRNLHIAHIIYGGALMLISLIIFFTFLNNHLKKLAAIIGGLGFGTFIDELGKFITRDNNYFYQPTFAIIYIIFVFLYLLFYTFHRYWKYTPKEYLINGLEYLKEAIINDLDLDEKRQALKYIARADQDNIITTTIGDLYKKIDALPPKSPSLISKINNFARIQYKNLISKEWFADMFNLFFIIQFIISIFTVLVSAIAILTIRESRQSSIELFDLFSSAFAGIFIIIGVLKMRKSRLNAYYMFKRSLIISIFLVQVFSFYSEQLNAFTGLLFNILVLTTLNYFIVQEKALSR